jgi:hypothetical protein
MTGQVCRSSNWIRLQQEVFRADCEITGKGETLERELRFGFATSAPKIVTPTQRILQLLESRGCLLLLFTSLLGSLSFPARSQQFPALPNTPSFNKKLFIAELSTYTAMNLLDGITTAHLLHEGYVEDSFPGGSSYLLGRRPSVVRYTVAMGLLETGVSLAAYRLQHSKTKWLRLVGHGLMIQGAYGHTDGVIRNIRLLQSP